MLYQLIILILKKQNIHFVCSKYRADDKKSVEEELILEKPTHVMSFIGRTHGTTDDGTKYTTIDYLEHKETLPINLNDNLSFNYDFSNNLLAITSSMSNIGFSLNSNQQNLNFIYLILVIIGGSFFSTSSGLRVIKVITLIKFSLNNLLSHSKPNQIYSNKLSLNKISADINDINKYFFAIIIFIFSLFIISILLTVSDLDFETSFKLGILTIMNTVNSEMYDLANLDFINFNIFSKISLIIFMIIGRIELLTVIILLKKFLFKN